MPRELHGPPEPASAASRRLFAPLLWFVAAALIAVAGPRCAPDSGSSAPAHIGDTFVVVHRGTSDADAWARLVDDLGPQLPGHVPLAPPPAEARAWQTTHLLYWIDDAARPSLARRFDPAVLRTTIAGIRARLASPLFGQGEDLRRDPLGLADLGAAHATPPIPSTPSGDLLSADGGTLLIHLQTGDPPASVTSHVRAQLTAHAIDDSSRLEIHTFPLPRQSSQTSIVTNLAILALTLALTLRRTRQSLIIAFTVGAGAALTGAWLGGTSASLALAAASALTIVRGTATAWVCVGAALLPLLLLPSFDPATPLAWGLAVALYAFAARFVVPPLYTAARARPVEPATPPRPLPPAAALVACTALVAAGAAWLRQAPVATHEADTPAAMRPLFDIGRTASLTSRGDTPVAALEAAARDARAVRDALPGARIDGPARHVLDEATLAARAAALAPLDLPGRGELLRTILRDHGLRPDAFSEFLKILDPGEQPSAGAALAGPLGPWLTASLRQDASGFAVTTRVLLPQDLPDRLPPDLHGPAIAAHRARHDLPGHLALALAAGAWLSAFFAWLRTRRLAPALAAAAVAATAQVAALAGVVAIHGEISQALLPALLVVGAVTAVLAASPTPTSPAPHLTGALACFAAPGLVLLAADDPTTHATGLVLAVGAALGGLLAAHATPGLSALFQPREARP